MNQDRINKIKQLKLAYEQLQDGQGEILRLVSEVELPDMVYNSNAIENSTLSLRDTVSILIDKRPVKHASLRETYEAVNLAEVIAYLDKNPNLELTTENIERLHGILLDNINPEIAGRIRQTGENVRVGLHIAPTPEKLAGLLGDLIDEYNSADDQYFLDKIAKFHLGFEAIHPFGDGNGRIGRVIINWQLQRHGYPPVIVQNRTKNREYYPLFRLFTQTGDYGGMSGVLYFGLSESLNKRLAYLRAGEIVKLSDYAKSQGLNLSSLINSAKRQTVPAFRVGGVWRIENSDADKIENI
jgi:Fic family protein